MRQLVEWRVLSAWQRMQLEMIKLQVRHVWMKGSRSFVMNWLAVLLHRQMLPVSMMKVCLQVRQIGVFEHSLQKSIELP